MKFLVIAAALAAALILVPALVSAPTLPRDAYHHPNHSWPVSPKLKPSLRLILLKRVKAHDQWVEHTAAKHHAGIVALHHRQLRWTLARIAKAKRQLRAAQRSYGPWSSAVASVENFSTGTQGGCGTIRWWDTFAATTAVPCGAWVEFCLGHRCAVGQREDSGPYIAVRTFDIEQGMAGKLGFSGVATVRWRTVR